MRLIDGLQQRTYSQGDYVVREGEPGEEFFIIEQGQLDCIRGEAELVRSLIQGDHFGEVAIIKHVKRTLSVRVSSDSAKVLVLSRQAFERILGTIREDLMADYLQY